MDRGIPTPNKLLSQLWTSQSQNLHLQRLRQVKPTINLRGMQPQNYRHLHQRKKKEQLAEGTLRQKGDR